MGTIRINKRSGQSVANPAHREIHERFRKKNSTRRLKIKKVVNLQNMEDTSKNKYLPRAVASGDCNVASDIVQKVVRSVQNRYFYAAGFYNRLYTLRVRFKKNKKIKNRERTNQKAKEDRKRKDQPRLLAQLFLTTIPPPLPFFINKTELRIYREERLSFSQISLVSNTFSLF